MRAGGVVQPPHHDDLFDFLLAAHPFVPVVPAHVTVVQLVPRLNGPCVPHVRRPHSEAEMPVQRIGPHDRYAVLTLGVFAPRGWVEEAETGQLVDVNLWGSIFRDCDHRLTLSVLPYGVELEVSESGTLWGCRLIPVVAVEEVLTGPPFDFLHYGRVEPFFEPDFLGRLHVAGHCADLEPRRDVPWDV